MCIRDREIDGVHYIERGYEDPVGKLRAVGADIESVTTPDEPQRELQDAV